MSFKQFSFDPCYRSINRPKSGSDKTKFVYLVFVELEPPSNYKDCVVNHQAVGRRKTFPSLGISLL